MNRNGSILVIDDEEIMREILDALLTRQGYGVRLAENAAQGLELARTMSFDAAVVDMMMPGMDGISALDELKKIDDDLPVLMITAFASVENAIAAIKRGAFDYITKPFKNDEVLGVLRNAVAQRRLVTENRALRQNLQAHANRFGEIIGRSSRMRQVFDLIIQAAPSRTTILINGESGTGKELVARSIHTRGARAERPFVALNCGAVSDTLLDSQLFGHRRGAFTGAVADHEGVFQAANSGTLFLDEIADIPAALQVKFLRAIQEREVTPLGTTRATKVDVRLIAATNRDLAAEVQAGNFRSDLYYRLNVVHLPLPPLRERREDIRLLAQHYVERYARQFNVAPKTVQPAALARLEAYDWPGNIRELQNVIERCFALAPSGDITAASLGHLVDPPRGTDEPALDFGSAVPSLETTERLLMAAALRQAGGNKNQAARLLGIDRQRLYRKLEKYGLE
jgi:DNA-binding NtrC family response regulator